MAVIDKLVIAGLRSFGPYEDDQQSIKISTPLTLILGENGCGKTTIIEALKFACSGDIPDGSKSGQGFVNDPKLSSMQSVKGQVRLTFADQGGNRYLVIKSVKVTNEGAKSKFERLNSTVKKTKPDGTVEEISSRCTDIVTVVCEALGVSKAILNNVIFCHQENAAWPLDEAKKLKEKFDGIFGATEYNKCAETLREIMKERDNKNKDLQSKVGMAKQTKEIVEKKRNELHKKEEKLSRTEDTIKEKDESLVPLMKRLQEISDLEDYLGKLRKHYTELENRRTAIIEQQNAILNNITEEFLGTDEQLQQEISHFEVNYGKLIEKIDSFKANQDRIENDEKKLSREINTMQMKLGKLQNEKQRHQDNLTECNNVICRISKNIAVDISSSSDDDSFQIINEIKRKLEIKKKDYDKLTQECDLQDVELQEIINVSHNELAVVKHAIETKTEQTQELKQKICNIDSKLHELDCSDEQLKSLENKIATVDHNLKNYKDSFDVDNISKNIDGDKRKICQYEEKLELLESDNKVLQQNSIAEAELDTLKQGSTKRESGINTLKNRHYENFNKIFGEDEFPPPGFTKKTIEQHKQNNTMKINELTKKIATKQKESTSLETKLNFQKDLLDKLQKELQNSEQKIFQLCEGKPYEKVCVDLHQSIEKLQKEKGQYSSARIMYEKFVDEFEKDTPCCPICQTGFNDKLLLAKEIVTNLKSKIQGIPEELNRVEEELKHIQELHAKVLQLKPIHSNVEELSNITIPILRLEVFETEDLLNVVNKELKDFNQQLSLPQDIVDACNKVIGDVTLIDEHHLELTRSQRKIIELEGKLVQVPSNKSKHQIEAEIYNLKIELQNRRQNCEASQKKLQQHNDECQELREERSRLVEIQLNLQKAMQGKPQLQEQLAESKDKQETLEREINELKMQICPLADKLKEVKENKESVKIKNRETMNGAQMEINCIQKSVDEINKLQQSIQAYIQSDGEGAIEKSLKELDSLQQTENLLEIQKKKINENINEAGKQLASQESAFRALRDNEALRTNRKEAESLTSKIDNLKKEIGDYNICTVLTEKQVLNKKVDTLRHDISLSNGVTQQLKEEIKRVETDLNSPENKEADAKFKRLLIEHTVAKDVKENLDVYLKALEYAIFKFHQERMAQINKTIKHLWRSIYRGNDCDYIEIKTDEIKTNDIRRTYNYKVVQMRSDVEIDMRGRCSAGQKVLACLVIRIALAETFSQNCGILALDEPTTNLDRANIESLSIASARIVHARQAEKNFQLLVITHDEEFLDALTKIDKVSHYWKVTRNEEGNSLIRKVPL